MKRYPIIVHFSADDDRLGSLLGNPMTKDWVFADERGGEPGGLSADGFTRLVCELAGAGDTECAPGVTVAYGDCAELLEVGQGEAEAGLIGYTRVLLETALAKPWPGHDGEAPVIAFNLLGFDPNDRELDLILTAFITAAKRFPKTNREDAILVLMLRDLGALVPDEAEDAPHKVREFVEDDGLLVRMRAFSYHDREVYDVDGVKPSWKLSRTPVESTFLHAALNASRDSVTEELVFRTNLQIGHFELPHAHLRTHYDVDEFVTRDFVKEYLFHELQKVVVGDRKSRKCFVLASMHTSNLHMVIDEFADKCTKHASVVFAKEIETSHGKALIEKSSTIVLIADFVNTGKTLKGTSDLLSMLLAKAGTAPAVKLFAIACMENSVSSIDGKPIDCLVRIPRPFYRASDCVLCSVKQPKSSSGTVTSVDGFSHAPEQLTPYDFWEIVGERDALFLEPTEDGSGVHMWVSTIDSRTKARGLVDRYKKWFTKLVAERMAPVIAQHGRIDLIVTVDERSGLQFSKVVAKAIHLSERSIAAVSRDLDSRIKLSDALPYQGFFNVLLVDDGINTGATMRMLAAYCQGACRLVGALVLDCRMTPGDMRILEGDYDFDGEIQALYQWRCNDDFSIGQLKMMMRNWDGEKYKYHPVGIMIDYHFRNGYPLDRIFKDNRSLYENVFANAEYLSAEERRMLVKVTTTGKGTLERLGSPTVASEFPLLASTARELIAKQPDVVCSHASQDSKDRRLGEDGAESFSTTRSSHGDALHPSGFDPSAVAIPLFARGSGESRDVLGTGFLFHSVRIEESCVDNPLLVTCAHVVNEHDGELEAMIAGRVYGVERLRVDPSGIPRDVAILSVTGLDSGTLAAERLVPSDSEVAGPCVSYGYQGTTGTIPNKYCPLERLDITAQSRYAIFKNQGSARTSGGTSGSPVFDSSHALVGMLRSKVDSVEGGQLLELVTASSIVEAVSEMLDSIDSNREGQ